MNLDDESCRHLAHLKILVNEKRLGVVFTEATIEAAAVVVVAAFAVVAVAVAAYLIENIGSKFRA